MAAFPPLRVVLWLGLALAAGLDAPAADLTIVEHGRPAAVLVVADQSPAVVRYAAEELAWHIEKATGARLPIVGESAPRPQAAWPIYLGDTAAARAAGIAASELAPEVFVLRTSGAALFIVGRDGAGDPVDPRTVGGTLFGVYELLERAWGVRWLWPGELGTFVPKRPTLSLPALDVRAAPRFLQRNVRGGLTFVGSHAALGFSPSAAEDYARAQTVFLRRHRMGQSERLFYRHAFTDWWEKYGREHPDWFQLVKGKRGPVKPGDHYSMCVSNPELHREIVAQWQRRREADPLNAPHYLNVVENGFVGLCECERCRAWDGPQPTDFLDFYPPQSKMALTGKRFVTDRYARFWLAVQREAEKIDPEVVVVAYNYFNYFYHPSPGLKLNSRILVGSYPSSGWYPRTGEENAWFLRQHAGWEATGARLFSRGNYCLDGYAMPHLYPRQFAAEFKEQVRRGLVATDYDALTGQWAVQGPNLYLLMRLQTRPDATADELLGEYYSGFGAAAPHVKACFDYWERYAIEKIPLMQELFADNTTRWRAASRTAHFIYPEECFAPAEKMLAQAAAAAAGDPEARARVAFLQAGLTHARLCVRVAAVLSTARPSPDLEVGRRALRELVAFRAAHERGWIANFNHSAWVEAAGWQLPETANVPAEQFLSTP